MNTMVELEQRFGIPGIVTFAEPTDGFVVVEVRNQHAAASIALQGGHVMNWTPRNQQPVLWMSTDASLIPGKSIRGGVPVCWPWFGPHATDASFPAHGFARTIPWELVESGENQDGATRLLFRLVQDEATRRSWPYPSELELQVIIGETLELDLCSRNTGSEPITIGDALHTYFKVGDVRQVRVHGLEGSRYIDKVGDGKQEQQSGAVTFEGETDRIFLDTVGDCVIEDPGLQRGIRIRKRGSDSTVVWNPWIEKSEKMGDLGKDGYLGMVCVESTNAADDVVTIAPGNEHHLWVSYSVEMPGSSQE